MVSPRPVAKIDLSNPSTEEIWTSGDNRLRPREKEGVILRLGVCHQESKEGGTRFLFLAYVGDSLYS